MSRVATAVGRAGRPRSEAADDAITAATLAVLCETGYGGLTVAGVIERAGVSSATLYRRWPRKQALVAAAVATLAPAPFTADTGSLESDLRAFVRHVAHTISARREDVAEALGIEAKRNPELADVVRATFLEPRAQELRAVLVRARARGELASVPPADLALSLVAGAIHHRAFVLRAPLTARFVETASTFALAGLHAAAG